MCGSLHIVDLEALRHLSRGFNVAIISRPCVSRAPSVGLIGLVPARQCFNFVIKLSRTETHSI